MRLNNPLDWIGLTADLVGIGTVILTVTLFWRARRRLVKALESLRCSEPSAPVALVIGLGHDIQAVVERHLRNGGTPMPIFNYHRAGMVPRDQFHDVLRDLLKIKQQINDAAATKVHLFYMGPVTLSIGIGALMDNWVPVTVYKYVDGHYEPEFVLQKETVLGLLDEVVDSGVEMMTKL